MSQSGKRIEELARWVTTWAHEGRRKDAVMRAFAAHELDVLVATTVIEVGVDVSNAAVMVILALTGLDYAATSTAWACWARRA